MKINEIMDDDWYDDEPMQKPQIKITSKNIAPYQIAYHGTSIDKWSEIHQGVTVLYLTDEPTVSTQYANEKSQEDGSAPILVKFKFKELVASLENNGQSPVDWYEDLGTYIVFSVHGPIEQIKPLGQIIPLT